MEISCTISAVHCIHPVSQRRGCAPTELRVLRRYVCPASVNSAQSVNDALVMLSGRGTHFPLAAVPSHDPLEERVRSLDEQGNVATLSG